jgi:AraC-like DNA-binding protein
MVQWDMVQNFTQYSIESKQSQINSKQIRQCINYIREHAHDSITVSEIAESVGLNETYLSKLFKKVMGCTVSEYIRNEKIAEACYLLTYTDKTSIEIATDLSFSSHSYFISVFKKVKGITPKEYRNQNREMK